MRRLLAPAGLACLLACAEWRLPPTFPRDAAGRPVIHEQALLGLSDAGDAAVAELVDADGEEPRLTLRIFAAAAPAARTALIAPREVVTAALAAVQAQGRTRLAVLQAAVARVWPEALERASATGFSPQAPLEPDLLSRSIALSGVQELGSIPLSLRFDESDAQALVLTLGERGGGDSSDGVQLLRATVSGERIAPRIWVRGATVWLLSGSFLPGGTLHRAVGLRHASLRRGESMLHNAHGLADYGAGDLDASRREFERAIAADSRFVEPLYNAAAAAALADRDEDAVAFLRRAAEVDPVRVQVLGRGDEDLKRLRKRPDVQALLGLRRPPREDIPAPP